MAGSSMVSLVTLQETVDIDNLAAHYTFGETAATGFADTFTMLCSGIGRKVQLCMATFGVSEAPISEMSRGTQAWANGMAMVGAIVRIAGASGKTVKIAGVLMNEGDTDSLNANANYAVEEIQFQADIDTDFCKLTGQTESIPVFASLCSSSVGITMASSVRIPDLQNKAVALAPGKIFGTGGRFQFATPYDTIHCSPQESCRWGEQVAHSVFAQMFGGVGTISPVSASIVGRTITVKLTVPTPPLVKDLTTFVGGPPTYNPRGLDGWEFDDGSGNPPSIVAWEVTDPIHGVVQISLSGLPVMTNPGYPVIAAAETGNPMFENAGPAWGQRICLRDSSAIPSLFGFADNYNWCDIFTKQCEM